MIAKRLTMIMAAAGMALAPVASANAASSLSLMGASSPLAGLGFFQDEDGDNEGGGSTAVILGVVLVVLFGAAAVSGSGGDLSNSP